MKTFDLTFKGAVLPEHDPRQVKTRFAQLFCIEDLSVLEELFSGETIILRSDLDRKSAADYFRKITQLGGEAELIASPDRDAAPAQGAVKLEQLPILYSIATLMVTNDSGPGHFSSITPLPTFVLFGPETPALYGSLGNSTPIFAGLACSPCVSAANHRKTPCIDNKCLQAISVKEVFETIWPVLSEKRAEAET